MDHINNEAKAFQREGLTCTNAQLIQGHARNLYGSRIRFQLEIEGFRREIYKGQDH